MGTDATQEGESGPAQSGGRAETHYAVLGTISFGLAVGVTFSVITVALGLLFDAVAICGGALFALAAGGIEPGAYLEHFILARKLRKSDYLTEHIFVSEQSI